MATPAVNLPPLPAGFTLDAPQTPQQELPPLPQGFTLDQPETAAARPDPFAGDDLLSDEAMQRLAAGERMTPSPRSSLPQRALSYGKEYLQGLRTADEGLARAGGPSQLGMAEAVTTLATGAIAAPILGTIESAVLGTPPEESHARYTYQPRSESGKAMLGSIGALAKPVTDVAESTGADIALAPLAAESQLIRNTQRAGFAQQALKPVKAAVATAEELGAAAKTAYKTAKDAGAVISPESYGRMASAVRGLLREQGFNAKLHPKAAAVLEEIEAAKGQPISFDELEILRRQALGAERSIEADERRIAGIIVDKLDDYGDVLIARPQDVLAGSAKTAVEATREARGLYARNRKAMEMRELIERADVRASQFSGSGKENALRTEFRQLALNQKRLRRFTQEEQTAIKEVAFGNVTRNTLRQIGKLAPTGGLSQSLSLLGTGAGFAAGGPLGAMAAPAISAVGGIARYGATRLTRNAAQRAEELMRRGPARKQAEVAAEPALSQVDEIGLAGEAFDAERAASAQAARGGYEVEELPSQDIVLKTTSNRLAQLAPAKRIDDDALTSYTVKERHGWIGEKPKREAARTAVAKRSESVPQLEAQMRALVKRAEGLPSDAPELLEFDAQYEILKEELALAKKKGARNRVTQLSGGR